MKRAHTLLRTSGPTTGRERFASELAALIGREVRRRKHGWVCVHADVCTVLSLRVPARCSRVYYGIKEWNL